MASCAAFAMCWVNSAFSERWAMSRSLRDIGALLRGVNSQVVTPARTFQDDERCCNSPPDACAHHAKNGIRSVELIAALWVESVFAQIVIYLSAKNEERE